MKINIFNQKLNTEDIGGQDMCSDGTEKDSQEGLKMEFSRQKETGKAKNDPEKNL